jgi:nucleotide-binding universal stress UspA family protein
MLRVSNILVPVDFSPGSSACVEYATAVAEALHSNVTLFHVFQTADLMVAIVPGADADVDDATGRALAERSVERLRAETRSRAGVRVSAVVVHGSPSEEIVSFAHDKSFDMVVIGTHGRTGLSRALMGSVAEAVVRRASCAVLTLHFPFPAAAG